ncbi:MAG: M48 family metalloprotease [Proteobacteria bacterium]|nr:M48 family metalloprotease [Pseudomonadota bacterium]
MVENTMKQVYLRKIVWIIVAVFFQFSIVSPCFSFSIGDEREVGEKLLYSVRSAFILKDDPDITQYVSKLGKDVLEVAGIQYFDYHFFVIDDKEFNAFAAPSGLIFFHSGLIGTMNSEDELVSVIAHEIGHIYKRHLASRVETGTYSGIASLGLALAAIAFGGATAPVLLTGALAAGQSVNLHFSRQNEEEADLLAYGWMKKLGRNPEGQVKMLESMRRISRYRSEKPPQYLLTHPDPEARLHYIQSLLDIDYASNAERISTNEDFEFIRFKYRILADVRDTDLFKNYLATVLADSRATPFSKSMAKYGLSQLAKNENDYVRSMELLLEVIAFFPDKNILKIDKGVIEFLSGKLVESEMTLRTALRIDTSDLYAAFTLAKLLSRTGRSAEAEQYFQTVSYQIPEYSQVYFELGQIAAKNNQSGLAALYLGKFDLYGGKLKLAEQSLRNALRDKTLSEKNKNEARMLLKKIELLNK